MSQLYVKYNPYRLRTEVTVDGASIPEDSIIYKVLSGKRLQEWIADFPKMIRDATNSMNFSVKFCGMALDWDDFEESFRQANKNGILNVSSLDFIKCGDSEDITGRIVDIFTELQKGPVEDFHDPKLAKAFNSIKDAVFPINVIATMSSGKSTLINALLGRKLMPSKNEACTAVITEILDTDETDFSAEVLNEDKKVIDNVPKLTYEIMSALNDNSEVSKVSVRGNIPFLDSQCTALMLVDTPGPNNSQNVAHKETTYKAINNDSNNLILYVLNGTQLSTNDDANLLRYVAEQMQKGGKQVRDRFLFVINKMDQFNPEEESIEKAIDSAKKYLAGYGINDPQIFPCSAFTALSIRTYLSDVDIDNLTRTQERMLPSAARDTLPMIDKFVEHEQMHLEKYTTLSPSAQQELDFRLRQAIERNDTKEQALIHSGIYSIEAAITAYVKKYAKTKKVKDLVESFEEILESKRVLASVKEQVETDESAAAACLERAKIVRQKIDNGAEAKKFKAKIEALDPIPEIEKETQSLRKTAIGEATRIFNMYGDSDTITNREDAERLIKLFMASSSDAIAKLSTELESKINSEIIDAGEHILIEYQRKLASIDESAADDRLDFQTVDLIKGALRNMRENTEQWTNEEFAVETAGSIGETTEEERVYYEKVGEEEEDVIKGIRKEKVGTEKVFVRNERKWVGEKEVRNPDKKWWQIWKPRYITEDVYEDVPVFEEKDVFVDVEEHETVVHDVFEERRETVKKYAVSIRMLQINLTTKIERNLDEGISGALEYAEEQVRTMKEQFKAIFAHLDELVKSIYDELARCSSDREEIDKRLEENRRLLNWTEGYIAKIEDIINI